MTEIISFALIAAVGAVAFVVSEAARAWEREDDELQAVEPPGRLS